MTMGLQKNAVTPMPWSRKKTQKKHQRSLFFFSFVHRGGRARPATESLNLPSGNI